ncbi:hypothetical protein PENTCL1PPCAC_246, partial [Pristionchus entomophagus]
NSQGNVDDGTTRTRYSVGEARGLRFIRSQREWIFRRNDWRIAERNTRYRSKRLLVSGGTHGCTLLHPSCG